jgi:hypothetical protein
MRPILLLFLLFITSCPKAAIAVEQQDCEVMDREEFQVALGWKVGGFGWGVGPEVSFGSSSGVRWSGSVQYMVAEYQELCSRYNTGRISKEEYNKEIQNIIQRSRRYERELAEYFKQKKQVIFNEMENQ